MIWYEQRNIFAKYLYLLKSSNRDIKSWCYWGWGVAVKSSHLLLYYVVCVHHCKKLIPRLVSFIFCWGRSAFKKGTSVYLHVWQKTGVKWECLHLIVLISFTNLKTSRLSGRLIVLIRWFCFENFMHITAVLEILWTELHVFEI